MHCHICDRTMEPSEIQFVKARQSDMSITQELECCSVCLTISLDAAYSGFRPNSDDEILEEGLDESAEDVFELSPEDLVRRHTL